jgi:hypothetical protein
MMYLNWMSASNATSSSLLPRNPIITSLRANWPCRSTRPVYGSGYETPMISYLDKDLIFIYEETKSAHRVHPRCSR